MRSERVRLIFESSASFEASVDSRLVCQAEAHTASERKDQSRVENPFARSLSRPPSLSLSNFSLVNSQSYQAREAAACVTRDWAARCIHERKESYFRRFIL